MRKTRTKLGALIATAVLAVGLAGCGTGSPVVKTSGDNQQISDGYASADLVPVIVELDGNRTVECVVLIGSRKGGVSCNWEEVTQR